MEKSDEENALNEEEKKKFVKNMMKVAEEAKLSPEEKAYAAVDKQFRRSFYWEIILTIIMFILATIIIYLNYN